MYQSTQIIGYLGKDPESRYTHAGVMVTSFSVATTNKWTGNDGLKHEETTWFRCSAWNQGNRKLAEICQQYLKKGSLVRVEGTIKANAYTGRDDVLVASLELKVNEITFLGGGEKPAQDATHVSGGTEQSTSADIPF